jgi:hypothetical protein
MSLTAVWHLAAGLGRVGKEKAGWNKRDGNDILRGRENILDFYGILGLCLK